MDFAFDRTAEGRALKALTIVDDATHVAVAIEAERAISGHGAARVLDWLTPNPRPAAGDPDRQRQGILRQGEGGADP